MPETVGPKSQALAAFVEGFTDKYAELRNHRRSDALSIIVPDVHHNDQATEIKRAYELANRAAHKWVSWGLTPYKGNEHECARSFLSQVPAISDPDTARQAEGLLGQARDLLTSGHSYVLVGLAQQTAAHAVEIDDPIPSEEAVNATANSAGQALAAAGIACAELAAAITEVTATMEELR
jgi:hypothetical protein